MTGDKMKIPPTEQDSDKDDCPICGLPLKYPALSRFDNETYVCSACGQAEGTGFLFAFSLEDGMREMLQDRKWQRLYNLTDWEAHTIVICAIRGACAGWDKKQKEAFEQLRKMEEE
jgi:predicted RNA-binding Zn-ribbon protein involved in translation (DUF1610 family)